MRSYLFITLLISVFSVSCNSDLRAQGFSFDLFKGLDSSKPERFKERKLGSEKSADKKFTKWRRFTNNNITRYNYYFNANTKLNSVVENARIQHKDDYSKLLRFYPYTLEATAAQTTELDSVILKSTAGILLHDLRSDWVDDMYLLIGKSYYYRKDFDSAALTFQYINYNLFPRKKTDDDYKVVGTSSEATAGKITIADKEKRNFLQKVLTLPPSRNDALVWYARTLIEHDELGEAASLINTLQEDPNLPKRLRNDLDVIFAYWFYKQNIYDSSAKYLDRGISAAENKEDQARWEFLIAQLYELSGNYDKASEFYEKSGKHTPDPVMDIFSKLNAAKMLKSVGNIKEIDNNIDKLEKMGRRDKFEAYRDVIYYSAGQMALQKPDTAQAIGFMLKSIKNNSDNVVYKNKAFLQLADIAYALKDYRRAFGYYDSLQSGDTTLKDRMASIQARRNSLVKVVDQLNIIEREDSLQRIASLPDADRNAYLKQMLRRLRKEQGLKDADFGNENSPITFNNDNNQPVDIFSTNTSKGEWYFYNGALRSRGQTEFRTKWGNRPNVDNWRRKAAMSGATSPVATLPGDKQDLGDPNVKTDPGKTQAAELTLEGLQNDLPLTPEKISESNNKIADALFTLGKLYQEELEDFPQAIKTYQEFMSRFPDSLRDGELYLNLYYCYKKLGNMERANYYKNLLNNKFGKSRFANMLNQPAGGSKEKDPAVTKAYEEIYTLFIEGKFDEARQKKKDLDDKYGGNTYWTPQLLYIESVHYISKKEDSMAIDVLQKLASGFPITPMAEKATTLIDVLKRRKEIEEYLNRLQVTRREETQIVIKDDKPVPPKPAPVTAQPVQPKPVVVTPPLVKKDSLKIAPPPATLGAYKMDTSVPHYVVMLLDKVDGTYINEAKNAFARYNREKYYGQVFEIVREALDGEKAMLITKNAGFVNAAAAITYYEKVKRAAPVEVSWLPANKYSFFVISAENLEVLKTGKDLEKYKQLLNMQFPGKF